MKLLKSIKKCWSLFIDGRDFRIYRFSNMYLIFIFLFYTYSNLFLKLLLFLYRINLERIKFLILLNFFLQIHINFFLSFFSLFFFPFFDFLLHCMQLNWIKDTFRVFLSKFFDLELLQELKLVIFQEK